MDNPEDFIPLAPGAEFPKEQFARSVIKQEPKGSISSSMIDMNNGVMTFNFASYSETVIPWGTNIMRRDRQLRAFWKSEDMLAGAVYSVVTRNAAFDWQIDAPPATKEALTNMFQNAIAGPQTYGWVPFIQAFSLDLYTQDNGSFIELIRAENRPDSPVIGIAHLDSGACQRTGNASIPVIYTDKDSVSRKMNWWNIIATSEFPSTQESMYGVGICAVSRVLRLADILKNIAVFKNEKVSGRFYKQIHFVGGVSKQEINDIMSRGQDTADNAGQTRYILPEIIASLDPEKPVSTATIDLAALPDNFDLDTELKWYISGLALGFGVDYQDFAPLPGGNLGTSMQSETLHRKSRGKSPKLFMQTLENIFHYYGVLPKDAHFAFTDRDVAFEIEEQKLQGERATARAVRIRSGEITPDVARLIAARDGDLTQEELSEIPDGFGEGMMNPDRQMSNSGEDTIGSSQADEVDVKRDKSVEGQMANIEDAFYSAVEATNIKRIDEEKEADRQELIAIVSENEKRRQALVKNMDENAQIIATEQSAHIKKLGDDLSQQQSASFEGINKEISKIAAKVDEKPEPAPIIQNITKKDDGEYEETIVVTKRDQFGRMLEAKKTRTRKTT